MRLIKGHKRLEARSFFLEKLDLRFMLMSVLSVFFPYITPEFEMLIKSFEHVIRRSLHFERKVIRPGNRCVQVSGHYESDRVETFFCNPIPESIIFRL